MTTRSTLQDFPTTFAPLPHVRALKVAKRHASQDETRGALTQVHVARAYGSNVFAVATDGHRLVALQTDGAESKVDGYVDWKQVVPTHFQTGERLKFNREALINLLKYIETSELVKHENEFGEWKTRHEAAKTAAEEVVEATRVARAATKAAKKAGQPADDVEKLKVAEGALRKKRDKFQAEATDIWNARPSAYPMTLVLNFGGTKLDLGGVVSIDAVEGECTLRSVGINLVYFLEVLEAVGGEHVHVVAQDNRAPLRIDGAHGFAVVMPVRL